MGRHARRSFNFGESLDGGRTTNAQVKNAEPGFRDNFFFLQQSDRFKNRPGVVTTGCGRSAMGYRADGAGSGLGLVGMVVGRLRYRCPQHQGQAEPCQPSASQTHTFLQWARFPSAYNGCLAQDNARQVTMGTEYYSSVGVPRARGANSKFYLCEGKYVRTNVRRTKSQVIPVGKGS